MSIPALNWAWQVRGISPSSKLVLVALANMADDQGKCWPGLSSLRDQCCLARSSVIEAVHRLKAQQLVRVDTVPGKGNVYWLRVGEAGQPTEGARFTDIVTHPLAGPVETFEPVREPDHPRPPTGPLPSVIQTPPVRQTDPNLKEPSTNHQGTIISALADSNALIADRLELKKKSEKTIAQVGPQLPDWMPMDAWNDFVEARRQMRKPLTQVGARALIQKLSGFRNQGFNVAECLYDSIANGWQGVFPPKDSQRAGASPRDANSRQANPRSQAIQDMCAINGVNAPTHPAEQFDIEGELA